MTKKIIIIIAVIIVMVAGVWFACTRDNKTVDNSGLSEDVFFVNDGGSEFYSSGGQIYMILDEKDREKADAKHRVEAWID